MIANLTARDDSGSIRLLRWSLALVLGGQALLFGLHAASMLATGANTVTTAPHAAEHAPLFLIIAGTELLGCVLLLFPRTRAIGVWTVLASLAGAAAYATSQGSKPPVSFVIYAVALLVVLQHRDRMPGAATP